MTDDETEPTNLILEHLRYIRGEIGEIKSGVREVKAEIISLRQQMNALQGDGLRREEVIAGLQVDLDRIKSRLDLHDA